MLDLQSIFPWLVVIHNVKERRTIKSLMKFDSIIFSSASHLSFNDFKYHLTEFLLLEFLFLIFVFNLLFSPSRHYCLQLDTTWFRLVEKRIKFPFVSISAFQVSCFSLSFNSRRLSCLIKTRLNYQSLWEVSFTNRVCQ